MERVTTKEAAKLLNMDVVTLQFLMRQEHAGGVYSERREMLNGRKTILLVEIAGQLLSGTDHQTTANFA